MRSDWLKTDEVSHVLAALQPANRLACEVALATGLRISDVLSMRTAQLKQRFTIKEQKTGKSRSVYLPRELLTRLEKQAGHRFVFEGRCNPKKHRTRQAVWKDIKRAAEVFPACRGKQISPHTLRKAWAVDKFKESGKIDKVQKALNHSDPMVTMIYALDDTLNVHK